MIKRYSIFRTLCRRSQPPTQASLFHYIRPEPPKEPFTWKGFWSDWFIGFRSPAFIPSVLGGMEDSFNNRSQMRTRRMEATFVSVLVHVSIILLAIVLVHNGTKSMPTMESIIPIYAPPFELAGDSSGKPPGGGGSGREEHMLPAWGTMPNAARVQLLAPDLNEPKPLLPPEEMSLAPSIEMSMEIARNRDLPMGDAAAPISDSRSYGPGKGGVIGSGNGLGVGPGDGPGYGPGKNGGPGGGGDGPEGKGGVYRPGVLGLKNPEILVDPKPEYTEEARKSRTEGLVVIQAIVRKNGTVDSFHVLQSLGHGLDESAIRTIATKWRFKPAQLNGMPVDVLVNIEVRFRMF
jgi:periplasmic protein TonB